MSIKIDKGVPIPDRAASLVGKGISEALRALTSGEIGDSVFIADVKMGSVNSRARELLGAGNFALRTQKGEGVRVWKIGPKMSASESIRRALVERDGRLRQKVIGE